MTKLIVDFDVKKLKIAGLQNGSMKLPKGLAF